MTMRAARFSQADVTRALRAAKKEGLNVKIQPDGTIIFVEKELSTQPTGAPDAQPLAPERDFRL